MPSRRVHRGDRGVALVELALIVPIIALLAFGATDLVRAYKTQIRLESAARAGAAHAQYRPNDVSCTGDDNDIGDHVAAEEAGVTSLPDFVVTVVEVAGDGTETALTGCSGTAAAAGDSVRVDVSATFEFVTPIMRQLFANDLSLTGDAHVVVLE